nr:MobA/MobL family protein [Yersinia sp. Marseille-Q3913]
MAIFHLEFKIVKRSEGMSSCRKAAYHARCKITDNRTGNTYDFSHRIDLFHHQILAPVSAPAHIIESSTHVNYGLKVSHSYALKVRHF